MLGQCPANDRLVSALQLHDEAHISNCTPLHGQACGWAVALG